VCSLAVNDRGQAEDCNESKYNAV